MSTRLSPRYAPWQWRLQRLCQGMRTPVPLVVQTPARAALALAETRRGERSRGSGCELARICVREHATSLSLHRCAAVRCKLVAAVPDMCLYRGYRRMLCKPHSRVCAQRDGTTSASVSSLHLYTSL